MVLSLLQWEAVLQHVRNRDFGLPEGLPHNFTKDVVPILTAEAVTGIAGEVTVLCWNGQPVVTGRALRPTLLSQFVGGDPYPAAVAAVLAAPPTQHRRVLLCEETIDASLSEFANWACTSSRGCDAEEIIDLAVEVFYTGRRAAAIERRRLMGIVSPLATTFTMERAARALLDVHDAPAVGGAGTPARISLGADSSH